MKKVTDITLILATLICLISLGYTEESENTTPSATTLPPKVNKTDIRNSTLCTKKCTCEFTTEDNLLDCTEKLDDWFSPEEWKFIQNGDIIFDTIKLSKNNFTTIPALPTYGAKHLYLDKNEISSIIVGAFQNWTKLTVLDLAHNKLDSKDLVPDVFKGPYSAQDFEPLNIKSLNLGYNHLHSLNDDLFEHVPYLEELVLCSNNFQVIDKLTETAVSGLRSLKSLDISDMELDSLPETIFHGPSELDTLIASGNLFREVPAALSHAKQLRRLVIDDNLFVNLEGENVFPEMPYLKYLSMSFMPKLNKIGSGALSELQNLTELILSDNQLLAEIDEFALSKNVTGGMYFDYPPLEKLYLNNCNLTVLPKDLIVRWDKLTDLDLHFNPWNCDETNEYMIEHIIQIANKTLPATTKNVKCAYPEDLKNYEVLKVSTEKLMATSHGSLAWIIIFVCVLLVIPLIIVGVVLYRRDACGWRRKNEIARRALYSRTSFNEDFHI